MHEFAVDKPPPRSRRGIMIDRFCTDPYHQLITSQLLGLFTWMPIDWVPLVRWIQVWKQRVLLKLRGRRQIVHNYSL